MNFNSNPVQPLPHFRPNITYAAFAIFGKTARRSTSQNKLAKEMKRILRSVKGRFFFLCDVKLKKISVRDQNHFPTRDEIERVQIFFKF